MSTRPARGASTLVTGATGRLGTALLPRLLRACPDRAFVVLTSHRRRAERWKRDRARAVAGAGSRLTLLPARLDRPGLGLSDAERTRIAQQIDRVVHLGAVTDPGAPLHVCQATNVEGTRRVLELAAAAPALRRFDHVSCAWVAGETPGEVSEEDLDRDQRFTSECERSKYESERAVRASGLPVAIHRPSHLLDDAPHVLATCSRWLTRALSRRGRPAPVLDAVPVAWVAEAMAALMESTRTVGGCFHLTAGRGREIPVVRGLGPMYVAALAGKPPLRLWSFSLAKRTPLSALYQDRDWVTFDAVAPRSLYLRGPRARFDNAATLDVLRRLGVGAAPGL